MIILKRDLDLIRNILLETEAVPSNTLTIYNISDKYNVNPNLVAYQLDLLVDQDLLKMRGLTIVWTYKTRKYDTKRIDRLTMEGHSYLDAIRNDAVWNKTLIKLSSIGTSASFEIVKTIATGYLKSMLGI